METYITNIIMEYGYLAIFLLIFIENIFPPIPSEIVLTFGGFMTMQASLQFIGVVIVATLGSYIGAVILYYIGRLLDPKRCASLLDSKWGKRLGFKKENVDKAQAWFTSHGQTTVFVCRLVPVIRSLISVPAGMANMNFFVFSIWTILGTLIWNTILVYIGSVLGGNWQLIKQYMQEYSIVIGIGILLIIIIYIYQRRKRKA